MERVIFIEELDRHGRALARTRVELCEGGPPFRIGSGYQNDFILDDPHVEPAHAVLEISEAGNVQLRDLETHNGCVLLRARGGKQGARAKARERSGARIPLGAETLVRIGRSRLRLRDESYTPLPARPLVLHSRPVAWLLEHWSAPLLFAALSIGALLASALRRETGEFQWAEAITARGFGLLFMCVWICVWSFANLAARGEHRISAHATIAFVALIISELGELALEWSRFLAASFETPQVLDYAFNALLFAALSLAHLGVLGVGRRALRLTIAALFAGGVLFTHLLRNEAREPDWTVTLPYWSRLEPANPRWLAPAPSAQYFEKLGALQKQLDDEAAAREE